MRFAACLLSFLLLTGCTGPHHLTIGSKNFTEQLILGEMAAQQLERKLHIPVDRKLNLGGTMLAHEALVAGQIDLYPEYTGTAAENVLKQSAQGDRAAVYMRVKDEYLRRFQLVWLPPLGFNDTFAMVVRSRDQERLGSATLSAATKQPWRLGVGYEFLTRPDGLQRIDKIYGLKWQGTPKTMDLGLLYQALEQNQIDMAAGNSTDGLLTDSRLSVLADDKNAFPPYDACFVARHDILDSQPGAREALTLLSGQVSREDMQRLNRAVDLEHQPVPAVVRDFLRTRP
jgi:osmoprotectant transport system substrate-binding protein